MDTDGIISRLQCERVLARYFRNSENILTSFLLTPLSNQLDGFIGEQYILKLQYENGKTPNELTFFVKILNGSNRVMFEMSKEMKAFEKESFYYETLLPSMLIKRLDCDYVTRSYFCEPYMIVLENLGESGYRGSGKNVALDFKHCTMCLKTLAKFHAEPILYELYKSQEHGKPYKLTDDYGDVLEDYVMTKVGNGANKFMRCSIKGMLDLIELVPENGVSRSSFKKALQEESNRLLGEEKYSQGFRSTIIHCDLWSNNFLYQYDKRNEIERCKIIDFQTVAYGPPAFDVMSFIQSNTRKSFRDKYQQKLLIYYYDTLSGLLEGKGFQASEILSEQEFRKSSEYFSVPAKIRAIVDRAMTFIPDDKFNEAAQSEETFSRLLFEDRGKVIIEAYESDDKFKDLITEDILELRSMLSV
ncbi:unnamed protein product [Phaedon cochleariae]|uniref:CHK kinase-like domain-containing protein n=1 Tax=Phaedon cochleariae TaxID=80249 RepID=A0A9N9SMI0_PHACE|nr:unnamed protein product [Phaedon cochleariae]